MADPLSIIASATGVIAFSAQTARTLITLAAEIRDAPEEILHVHRDVQGLAAVLQSVQDVCLEANLQPHDQPLLESVVEYVQLCQGIMIDIKKILVSVSDRGSPRWSPLRTISWTLRKGEVRALRDRLQEVKASLNLTALALKGVMDGKAQEEIKAEVNKVYAEVVAQFRSAEYGRKVRRRVEDDLSSVSNFGTDAGYQLERYLQEVPVDSSMMEPPEDSGTITWDSPTISLLEATQTRNCDLVSRLVKDGTSLRERSSEGYTALHYCAIYDDSEIADVLIRHGAEINARDNQVRTPLQLALASDSVKVATLLVQNKCALGNATKVICECFARRSREVPELIDLLKSLTERLGNGPQGRQGRYMMDRAIDADDAEFLDLLCEAGFDVNAKDEHGFPPLFQALLQRREGALKVLVERGALVNYHLPKETEQLLDDNVHWHGELNERLEHGATPLFIAASIINSPTWTRLLLASGADPNYRFEDGGILLMGICAADYLETAQILVEGGSQANHQNKDGLSAIYWASRCDNPQLLRLLLEHGGNVNLADESGWTPLHLSACDGDINIVKVALEYGADTSLKTSDGDTPAMLASQNGHTEIEKLIEVAGSVTLPKHS